MEKNDINNEVKTLVGKDRLQEAIESLMRLYMNTETINDIILIKGRLKELERREMTGMIEIGHSFVERNKIRQLILKFAEVEQYTSLKTHSLNEFSPNDWSKKQKKSFWNTLRNLFEDK